MRPMITLRNLTLTPQDEQDLRAVQPFVLTTRRHRQVRHPLRRQGERRRDPLLHVHRQAQEDGERRALLRGEDLGGRPRHADREDIRQGRGPAEAQEDNQFPKFETYRQQIDGKYWFPVYTHADDVLHFQNMSQRIRMVVKYQNYKRFGAETTITFGDAVPDTKK